jgi:hypothetical protein
MSTTVLNFSFALAFSVVVFASDAPGQSNKDALDFRQLVAQLASPNEPPKTNNRREPHVTFPASYDRDAQKKVYAARQLLHENFADALPELVSAIGDQRYSVTINWAEGDGYYNESVGAVCKNIIASQLEVYRAKLRFSGPGHWHQYTYPVSKEWWEANKEKSHRELQVLAIDWAIDQRKKDTAYNLDERENEVRELMRLREQLASSDKPLPGSRMYRIVSQDK